MISQEFEVFHNSLIATFRLHLKVKFPSFIQKVINEKVKLK